MLACNCLNVIIETESNDFLKVNSDSLHLNEEEAKDIFFKQDIVQIGKLTQINKVHAGLIETRNIGAWFVHKCLNCSVHTHAVHREKGAGLVLVYSKLLTTPDILTLRKNSLFSNVFNMIVNTNLEVERSLDYLPADVELMIGSLKQQANKSINKEVVNTEERVRLFTEQQIAALDEFRERTLKEQRALSRVILNSRVFPTLPKVTSTNMSSPVPVVIPKLASTIVPDENSVNMHPPAVTKSQARTIVNMGNVQSPEKRPIHRPVSEKNSFDAEGLFQLEDMDDLDYYPDYDGDLSDTEDKERDEGLQIKQKLNEQMNLAKSLPMNIPVFMSPFHGHENEDQEDMLPHPEDPMDIAASIKALAKSVHGDTVFGDLPRPRCRTNI